MKKFIKNTANSIRTKAIRLAATRRSGEGYIDTAVKILIAVVLGALLLAGLYALFGDVVMPTLNQRIKDTRTVLATMRTSSAPIGWAAGPPTA